MSMQTTLTLEQIHEWIREHNNLSTLELSKQAKVNRSHLTRFLQGKHKTPSLDFLVNVIAALGGELIPQTRKHAVSQPEQVQHDSVRPRPKTQHTGKKSVPQSPAMDKRKGVVRH
jgi:transcriptional regulator with XRE-family HTH domain